jgi:molybdopterin synthase sulfur carrier subunit
MHDSWRAPAAALWRSGSWTAEPPDVLACDNTGVQSTPTPTGTAPGTPVTPVVTVRYWAAARAAAGRTEDVVSGDSVAEVLAAVRRLHAGNARLLQVLAVSSLLLGDSPLGSREPATVEIRDGDTVEVLPPFAGG